MLQTTGQAFINLLFEKSRFYFPITVLRETINRFNSRINGGYRSLIPHLIFWKGEEVGLPSFIAKSTG
jgi:hypothetical protein